MSLTLTNLQHLRVGWQKVRDQYNRTAYVAQLGGSAGWACYTNRSDAEAVGTIIETLIRAGTPDQKRGRPPGRKSETAATRARNDLKGWQSQSAQRRRLPPPAPPAICTPGSHGRRRRRPARSVCRRSTPGRPDGQLPGPQPPE